MGTLAALGVFSSLSVNLLLQFGLGMRGLRDTQPGPAGEGSEKYPFPLLESAVIFLSVTALWLVFTFMLAPLRLGFFPYILLFPLSAPACVLAEGLLCRLVWRHAPEGEKKSPPLFQGISAYEGMVPLALLVTLNVAFTFTEAVILSLGFALGLLFSILILNEIRRRSGLEAIPPFLRGVPLTLISMGLLSLIFTSVAAVFYNVLR
jgi:electron transport complex protein RnfA